MKIDKVIVLETIMKLREDKIPVITFYRYIGTKGINMDKVSYLDATTTTLTLGDAVSSHIRMSGTSISPYNNATATSLTLSGRTDGASVYIPYGNTVATLICQTNMDI